MRGARRNRDYGKRGNVSLVLLGEIDRNLYLGGS